MIIPDTPQPIARVAAHYDELDLAYRWVWGEHVHHGYWKTGRESPAEAAEALLDLVETRLDLHAGENICDIGCGYGASAARLATHRDVSVVGLTVSGTQQEIAQARETPGFTCLLADWLDNSLADASFDHAYAIESSEHMADKARFFAEARRVLRPGGRLVVCAWLEGPTVRSWEVEHLLKPICAEGRLPSMGSGADYERLAGDAGFALCEFVDISREVRRTWSICLRRLGMGLIVNRAIRRLALRSDIQSRSFMLSLPRLIVALRTGAMRYGIFTWERRA